MGRCLPRGCCCPGVHVGVMGWRCWWQNRVLRAMPGTAPGPAPTAPPGLAAACGESENRRDFEAVSHKPGRWGTWQADSLFLSFSTGPGMGFSELRAAVPAVARHQWPPGPTQVPLPQHWAGATRSRSAAVPPVQPGPSAGPEGAWRRETALEGLRGHIVPRYHRAGPGGSLARSCPTCSGCSHLRLPPMLMSVVRRRVRVVAGLLAFIMWPWKC